IYTVTEQGTEEGGAAQIETYSLSASGGGQVAVEKGKTASAQLVNAYTRDTASLSVSKIVDGNMGNRETPFAFTVTLESALPSDYTAPEGVSLNADRTVLSFSLKHGQSVTLPDLPIGAMLTILETNGSGYSTSHSVPGGEDTASEDSQQARTCAFTLPAEGAAISYTNSLNVVIPTGIALDSLPYLVLITLGALMLALLAPFKRRKRED
ncbi:MAG: hypothetical protein II697_01470, partial [Clostridia bacterium]|nr:hypothetical protein [Clostridia bacterium]